PEKPLHSNSIEKGRLTRKPILYREPGREGKSGGKKTGVKVQSWKLQRQVFILNGKNAVRI
ncbi:MAG: hypothetical protein WCD15_19210, partial [Terriglobales bacterium]